MTTDQLIILIGGIILVISLMGIATAAYLGIERLNKLMGKTDEIKSKIPDTAFLANVSKTVNNFDAANQNLAAKIESFGNTVTALPGQIADTVGKEVSAGLGSLVSGVDELKNKMATDLTSVTSNLSKAHENFQAVLMTISEDGHLQRLISNMENAVVPFREVGQSISQHYRISAQLAKNSSDILTQWAEQRSVIDKSYKDFASLLEKWTGEEMIHRRDIETRLFERLEELAVFENKVSDQVMTLNAGMLELTNAHKILGDSIEKTANIINGISARQDETTKTQQENINHQGRLQNQIQAHQEILRSSLNDVQKMSQNLIDHHIEQMDHIRSLYENNAKEQKNAITEIAKLHVDLRKSYLDLTDSQKRHMDGFGRQLDGLARIDQQRFQSGLLIALVAVMSVVAALLAYSIFTK